MAKRILLGVLQDYFGRYIDGINEENLKLAVWAGEIDLEGLELKKEVLDSLRLPLTIHCGHISKFKVLVPWSKLGSQPVEVHIDGVYLLARLAPEDEDKEEDDEEGGEEGEEAANDENVSKASTDHEAESVVDDDDENEGVREDARDVPDSSADNCQPIASSSSASPSAKSTKRTARRNRKKKLPRRIVEKRIRLRWANLLAAGEGSKGGEHRGAENAADQSFWSRLGAKIMDNIQINITNVHVRLEDMMSITGHPFAAGVTFEKFSAVTCDEKGDALFVERNARTNGDESDRTFFKSIQIQSLAAYWDVDKPMIFNKTRSEFDFAYQLARGIWRKELRASYCKGASPEEPVLEFRDLHHFLLRPCSPSMLVAKNESSDFSKPRYKMDVDFDDIAVIVSRQQYAMALALQRSLAQNSILSVYREQRPLDSPVEDPVAWWKYAYKCIKIRGAALRLNRQANTGSGPSARDHAKLLRLTQADQRTDWGDLVRQVQQREKYIRLYKQLLYAEDAVLAKTGKKALNTEGPEAEAQAPLRASVQELEDEFEVENTLAYRAAALAEITAEQKKTAEGAAQQNASRSKGWLSGWFAEQGSDQGGGGLAFRDPVKLTAEEKAELIDAVNFFETIQDHNIPEGTIHVLVRSSLRYGSVALANEAYDRVLFSSEIMGKHTLETRFGNSWKHSFVLKNLTLFNHDAAQNGYEAEALVLAPKHDGGDEIRAKGNACVLNAEYRPAVYAPDTNEPISKELYSVRVAAVPFRVILLPHWVNALSRFFHSRSDYQTALESIDPLHGSGTIDVILATERTRRRSSAANHSLIRTRSDTQDEMAPAQSFDQGFNAEVNWVADYIERSSERTQKLEEASLQSVVGARLRPDFDVRMNVAAPILLFPIFGLRVRRRSKLNGVPRQSLFIVDLGHIQVLRQDAMDQETSGSHTDRHDHHRQQLSQSGLRQLESMPSLERQLLSRDSIDSASSLAQHLAAEDDILDAVETQLDKEEGEEGDMDLFDRDPGRVSSLDSQGHHRKRSEGASDQDQNAEHAHDPNGTALGAWNISVKRIRSRILILPPGTHWTTALAEDGSGFVLEASLQEEALSLVDEFDVDVALFHLFSQKRSPRVETCLSTVTAYVTPAALLSLSGLRGQWSKEPWWWLAGTDTPAAQDVVPRHRRASSFSNTGVHQSRGRHDDLNLSAEANNEEGLTHASKPMLQQSEQPQTSFGTFYGFTSTEIVVHVSTDRHVTGKRQQRFITCTLRGLEAQYIQRSKGSSAHAELQSLDALDLIASKSTGPGSRDAYFIQSEADSADLKRSLISIDMHWRHADAPDAGPKLIYTVAKFHKLRVELDPDTAKELEENIFAPFREGTPIEKPSGESGIMRASSTSSSSSSSASSFTSSPEMHATKPVQSQSPTGSETVRFRVEAYMASLTLALRKRGDVLAEASMTRTSVAVNRGTHIRAQGELGNVLVTSRGHELFSVASKDQALVKVSVTTQPRKGENHLQMQINSSRYKHLHLVFLEVKDYFSDSVVAIVSTLKKSLVPSSPHDQQPTNPGTPESPFSFKVNMETFEAMFPVTAAVDEARFFAATCATLCASHNCDAEAAEVTKVRMEGFRIFTSEATLLDTPVNFVMDLSYDEDGLLKVQGHISDVIVQLPLTQYWLIQDMFSYNIMEEPMAWHGEPQLSPSDSVSSFGSNRDEGSSEEGHTASHTSFSLEETLEEVLDELLLFSVDIQLGRASLQLLQPSKAPVSASSPSLAGSDATPLAEFSMKAFRALVLRDSPGACTAIEIRVGSLDLIDSRVDSGHHVFRHLIQSDPRDSASRTGTAQRRDAHTSASAHVNRELACFFRYVHSEKVVRLDLVGFRSVFMADLLVEVVQFWTSSDDSEAVQLAQVPHNREAGFAYEERAAGKAAGPSDSDDAAPGQWRGEFNLVDPCICFVPDYADAASQMVVVRSNISFTWTSEGDPDKRQFSHWTGCLSSVEAYVASAGVNHDDSRDEDDSQNDATEGEIDRVTSADDDKAFLAIGQRGIQQQLVEPTDLNWSYEYEEVALGSKVHARRVDLKCGQLELYVSMNDAALIGAIVGNMRSSGGGVEGAASDDLHQLALAQTTAQQKAAVRQLHTEDSGRTFRSEDDGSVNRDEIEADAWALEGRNDEDYLEFVVPEGTPDVGLRLEQDHGFVRVAAMYNSFGDGAGSICESFGVQIGDYLLKLNGEFVCNESPEIIWERLVAQRPPFTLKFLRGSSDKPVILQDSLMIGTQKVIFNMIDDLDGGDMPLSNLVLSKVDLFLNGSNDGNYVSGAQMEMTGAHFYDLRAGSWGVLMDPGRVNLSCTYYNSGELDMSVDIPDPISCNLPDTFLRVVSNSLARAGESARAEGRRLGSAVSAKALRRKLDKVYAKSKQGAGRALGDDHNKAFLFRNESGLALKFWKQGEDPADTAIFMGPEDAELPLGFPYHSGMGHGTIRGFSQYKPLCVAFFCPRSVAEGQVAPSSQGQTDEITDEEDLEQVWETLEGVVVNKIGDGVARLVARKSRRAFSPNGLRVRWSVEIDDATRKLKVVVTSLLQVQNHLDYNMRVLANCPTWPSARALPWTLPPGESRRLPLLYGDAIEIRVQPMLPEHLEENASHAYEWSGPIHAALASQGNTAYTELECSLSNGMARYLCASVEPDEDGITTVFALYPQVRFRNLLPQDIDFQEHIPAISPDMPIGGGRVSSGEEKQLHSLTSASFVGGTLSTLVMKLEDSGWTDQIPLQEDVHNWRESEFYDEGDDDDDDDDEFELDEDEEDLTADGNTDVGGARTTGEKSRMIHHGNSSSADDPAQDANVVKWHEIVFAGLTGRGVGEENLCRAKIVCEEAEAGGLLVVVYADYWIVNHTGLELLYGPETGTSWVAPTPLNTAKGQESIVLFQPPDGRMRIAHETAASAQIIDVTTPGMQGHVVLPNRAQGGRLSPDLGVAVDVGPGLLHRTNMVTIVPRFTFANYTGCDLYVRAYNSRGSAETDVLHVIPGGSTPFWMSSTTPRETTPRFQIRFGAQRLQSETGHISPRSQFTEWSQRFDVEELLRRRAITTCRLKREKFYENYQLEVQVGDTAGSVVVELSSQGFEQQLRADNLESLDSIDDMRVGASDEGLSGGSDGKDGESSAKGVKAEESTGFWKRFTKVRFEMSVKAVEINLQRDQTDLSIFHRGLETARREREDRIAQRTGVRSRRHASSRPEVVAALSLRMFKTIYETDKIVDKILITCQSLDVTDQTRDPMFPRVLSQSAAGPTGPGRFFSLLLQNKRTKKPGYTEFNLVEAKIAPLDLCLAETFILELLDFKTSVLHTDKKGTEAVVAAESGVESHHDKLQSATLYDLGGGLLSRMNLRVDKARMNLETFEKLNFIGSATTLWTALQTHYQNEARNSMMGIFSAVSLRSTDFGIAAAIRDRLSLTSAKVQSDEFKVREFRSGDALIAHFKSELRPGRSCSNIESFVRLLRNLVFDWRNNHRFLYGRRVCVIGVINRSSKGLRVDKPRTNHLARDQILVPHTEIPPGNTASMLEPWQPGHEWNEKGYTAWLVSSKFKEAVSLESKGVAFQFKATVPGEIAITASQNFNVAFVHRDVQTTNALYVIAIEDRLPISFRS
ncbi:Vacuolar protein sorting-associated protein 13C [Hondaea fermentalgiana]|uniref:Vacuolar protein sorting-associated protein 13C n=1 Tax=Hondaea fermentalgiana TaxID=2315210 RepID=A0A2R5GQ85_9STRA|nr:Vacuolar protein sorting-associated protein 13C [Hondaea fermentalgiana]|eukprot:GBG32469.1 Vacuolar protein sorting-associated protein 13C [Hondaea fermentalgiana]